MDTLMRLVLTQRPDSTPGHERSCSLTEPWKRDESVPYPLGSHYSLRRVRLGSRVLRTTTCQIHMPHSDGI